MEGWDPDLRTFSAAAYRSSCTHWYGHGYLQCNDTVLYDRKFPFLGNEIVKLIFSSLQTITNIVFNNIPLLFAMGVAQGMAKKEKGIAVFAATVGYLTLNVVMSVYLKATGTLADPAVAAQVGQGYSSWNSDFKDRSYGWSDRRIGSC